MQKYVEVNPINSDGDYGIYLRVGVQRFSISDSASWTKAEADRMKEMLCYALARLVDETRTTATSG